MQKLRIIIAVGVLAIGLEVHAARSTFKEISEQIREQSATAVKILTPPRDKNSSYGFGTGFIMRIGDSVSTYYLVTNRHVFDGFDSVKIVIQVVDSTLTPTRTDTSVIALSDGHGKSHVIVSDQKLDIAAVQVDLPRARKGSERIKVAGEHSVAHPRDIFGGQDVLFYGYPLGVAPNGVQPLIRQGMIAGIDTQLQIVYLDTQAFPGSSGSPVFMDARNALTTGPSFIGVIASYVPFMKHLVSAETGGLEMVQTENSGIAQVVPAWQVENMIRKAKSK